MTLSRMKMIYSIYICSVDEAGEDGHVEIVKTHMYIFSSSKLSNIV